MRYLRTEITVIRKANARQDLRCRGRVQLRSRDHQMRIELRDPEVLKQHLNQMGVMLSVPTSTYLGSRGVTASTNATIDTLFIG